LGKGTACCDCLTGDFGISCSCNSESSSGNSDSDSGSEYESGSGSGSGSESESESGIACGREWNGNVTEDQTEFNSQLKEAEDGSVDAMLFVGAAIP